MAYDIPTPADVKSAYPQFSGVADATIQEGLDHASLVIDTSWPEPAFPLAYKSYAAHWLTVGGYGTENSGQAQEGLASNVKSRKAGDHAIEFFGSDTSTDTGTAAWYALTPFGKDFKAMQRRYFGGPRVY